MILCSTALYPFCPFACQLIIQFFGEEISDINFPVSTLKPIIPILHNIVWITERSRYSSNWTILMLTLNLPVAIDPVILGRYTFFLFMIITHTLSNDNLLSNYVCKIFSGNVHLIPATIFETFLESLVYCK